MQLDGRRARLLPWQGLDPAPIRLAVLASSAVDHLLLPIQVAGMRRGLWIETYTQEYGQYTRDLMNPTSGLHRFRSDAVLLARDAHHLTRGIEPDTDVVAWLEQRTTLAAQRATTRRHFACQVIQTIPLAVFIPRPGPGGNEHCLP